MKNQSIPFFALLLIGISFTTYVIFVVPIMIHPLMDQSYEKKTFSSISIPHLSLETAWISNGTIICNASDDQNYPKILGNESEDTIIVWRDFRNGFDTDIYAQCIDSNGGVKWTPNGVALCTASNFQLNPQICSDGTGGAIITWDDQRDISNTNIYAQRVSSSGVVSWTVNGELICSAINVQNNPQITDDGMGGAIIVWTDARSGTNIDIYTQRIDSNGAVLWTPNGVVLCNASFNQENPQICSDGAGGAIIMWEDYRNGSNYDIYAQCIDSNGVLKWMNNGTSICSANDNQRSPKITSDGEEGAIITWYDYRSGSDYDIFAQRINSNGTVRWTVNGEVLCTAVDTQNYPQICSDGAGGAIITWNDYRSGSNWDIYAQRIDSEGDPQWTLNGEEICIVSNNQDSPFICSDGTGGAIIVWQDFRNGINTDIYAQRIDINGAVKWTPNGLAVCNVINNQGNPQVCSDGAGGGIFIWDDYRTGSNYDIFGQHIEDIEIITNGDTLWILIIFSTIIVSISLFAAIVVRKPKRYISAPKSIGKFSIKPIGVFITIEFTKLNPNDEYEVTIDPHTTVESMKTRKLTIQVSVMEKLMTNLTELILPKAENEKIEKNKKKILEMIRTIGKTFYNLCFPNEIRKDLESEECRNIGTIKLVLESHLLKYPWELFHDEDNFLGLTYSIGRFVKVKKKVPNIPYPGIGMRENIKFLIIGDPDDRSSAARNEANELDKFLKKIKNLGTTTLVGSENANFANVTGKLSNEKEKYDFIHITAHSDSIGEELGERGIRLGDTILTAEEIERMDPGKPPILAFINACESGKEEEWYDDRASGLASSFLKKGINFIGPMWFIWDTVAFKIAFSFYSEFLRGRPIGESLKRAKLVASKAFKEKKIGWASYVLYGDPNYTLVEEQEE